MDDRFTHRTVQAGRQRVHLVEAGTGPLVLMCHGFPESWYSWRHQLTALSEAGYRAVAMDMRGYGRSGKPLAVTDYRITELVNDCVELVHALGEQSAVIVGHDWGAPVAWTAAWTRPDVFRAVAGLSVTFGGRGLMGLPGDPLGERRPSLVEREVAGPDLRFYQEHFCADSGSAEFQGDVSTIVRKVLYGLSADAPLPPELAGVDLTTLPEEGILAFTRAVMCLPPGIGLLDRVPVPETMPPWASEADVEFYVSELEHTGFEGGLNYYRNVELDWELLEAYEGQQIRVPSLFIGGDRDVATIWGKDAIALLPKTQSDLRGAHIIRDCGHWMQQEQPGQVNDLLLEFLRGL
ncbi:MAG TPA: alpha/beta hydrolase [Pseudonocardia sp.]|jgi:pimeloyl-ACP methyl ester carboxylesterase|nr:alpha/beta hydrolase [Pseudonocardia sp.]